MDGLGTQCSLARSLLANPGARREMLQLLFLDRSPSFVIFELLVAVVAATFAIAFVGAVSEKVSLRHPVARIRNRFSRLLAAPGTTRF
jgi:hypothetical protein